MQGTGSHPIWGRAAMQPLKQPQSLAGWGPPLFQHTYPARLTPSSAVHDEAALSINRVPNSRTYSDGTVVPLQVLEENRGKDLAESLAEYNRVRKPDMDALRHFDTISTRIWGGKLVFHRESPLTHRLHATSPPAAAAPWAAVRCWPSEKSKFGSPLRCRNRLAGWLQAAGSPSGTSTGRTSAPRPTSWCPARCTDCCPEYGLPPPCWWVHPDSGRPQETSSTCGASHDLAPVILTNPKLISVVSDRRPDSRKRLPDTGKHYHLSVSCHVRGEHACRPAGITLPISIFVHFVTLHTCSHTLWCRRRDLGILACAAIAAIALGIKVMASMVGA